MKIYLAGLLVASKQKKLEGLAERTPHILESYLEFRKDDGLLDVLLDKFPNVRLFLDSGAFSAFTRDVKIDIDEYIEFIKKYRHKLEVIANLDVIGDSEATYKNWTYMKGHGVDALPVFHYGSDIKYLQTYLNEHKTPYIALGGLVPYSKRRNKLREWLDYCYSHLKNYKDVKVHLFGITTPWVLFRYPCFSADSTGWLAYANHNLKIDYKGLKIKTDTKFPQKLYHKRGYKTKYNHTIDQFINLQRDVTLYWKDKGITYE